MWIPVTVLGPRKRYRLLAIGLGRLLRKLKARRVARRRLRGSNSASRDRVAMNGPLAASRALRSPTASPNTAVAAFEYGLLVYEGDFYNNIGDDIQSTSAMRFLPRIDYLIPIDKLNTAMRRVSSSPPVKVIMNGYFTCNPDSWPPPDWIQPLFVSFHLSDIAFPTYPSAAVSTGKTAAEILLTGGNLEYFKRHEPIGCRDHATVERFKSAGVQAYFTGCLTLTLNSAWHRSREKIYLVDVDCDTDTLLKSIPRHLRPQVVAVSHDLSEPGKMSYIERFSCAHELLMMYRSARLIVTSRLHCALPSLALGTNVLFLEPLGDRSRLGGLNELLNRITLEDIARRRIDWETPPANPSRHVPLADHLRTTCRNFIGAQDDRPLTA
jgi:hypothetical protein